MKDNFFLLKNRVEKYEIKLSEHSLSYHKKYPFTLTPFSCYFIDKTTLLNYYVFCNKFHFVLLV